LHVDAPELRPLSTQPPRILFLHGSPRERSYGRLLAEEAGRIIEGPGAEVRVFDPREPPMVNSVPSTHPDGARVARTLALVGGLPLRDRGDYLTGRDGEREEGAAREALGASTPEHGLDEQGL
jgi:hypothetical protein